MHKEIKKYKYLTDYVYETCKCNKKKGCKECSEGQIFKPTYTEFTFKPVNAKFRVLSEQLKNTVFDLLAEATREYEIEKLKHASDTAEYKYYDTKIKEKHLIVSKNWLIDEKNQKELFETCLLGDLSLIDYVGDDDIKYMATLSLAGNVLSDFFSINSTPITK